MDIGKIYQLDEQKEIDGVWRNIGNDCELKIACFGNPHFEKIVQSKMKPFNTAIRNKTFTDDQWSELFISAIAEAILIDWKNVDDGGVSIPYSKENAVLLMKKYRKFKDMVIELSKEEELYRKEDKAASEKNFGKSFIGK